MFKKLMQIKEAESLYVKRTKIEIGYHTRNINCQWFMAKG